MPNHRWCLQQGQLFQWVNLSKTPFLTQAEEHCQTWPTCHQQTQLTLVLSHRDSLKAAPPVVPGLQYKSDRCGCGALHYSTPHPNTHTHTAAASVQSVVSVGVNRFCPWVRVCVCAHVCVSVLRPQVAVGAACLVLRGVPAWCWTCWTCWTCRGAQQSWPGRLA